jgi:hypothetical protein
VTWIYDHLFPDGRVERFTAETAHHMLPANDYLDEIRGEGLEEIEVYGDFDKSPYQGDSPYLICVAKN